MTQTATMSTIIGNLIAFRLLRPSTWPSFYKLFALLPLIPTISTLLKTLSSVDDHHRTGQAPASLLIFNPTFQIIAIIFAITVKIINFLNERREHLKLFDKGNVPSVGNKHPLSGNLFEVIVPPNNIEIIDYYHRKLGKNFGMFYGPDPWVFSTDLDLLHKLFITEGNKNVDVTQFRMPFITEISTSLSQVQGDEWRRTRRILNPSFTHRQMKSDNVFEDIQRACTRLLDCISGHKVRTIIDRQQSLGGKENKETSQVCRIVDVLYNFKKYSVDVIFQVAYGRDNGVNMEPEARDPLLEAVHAGSKEIRGPVVWTSIMFENSQRALGYLARFRPIGRSIKYIHAILDDSLERRRAIQSELGANERKMIDSIIESVASNKMDDEQLKANLFFIFIAGFETSANTLAILFWLLAGNLHVQEALRAAIAIEGEDAKYLEWCLLETLRLYPAVPTAIGRVLQEDIEYKGQTFFKGTSINASIYSIHHSSEYWGADVEVFRPERFGETNNDRETTTRPTKFFAFAHGPRKCIGSSLAMAELKAIVARLLIKYRVEFCDWTPKKLEISSPNLIHMIIEGRVDLKFIEISSL